MQGVYFLDKKWLVRKLDSKNKIGFTLSNHQKYSRLVLLILVFILHMAVEKSYWYWLL